VNASVRVFGRFESKNAIGCFHLCLSRWLVSSCGRSARFWHRQGRGGARSLMRATSSTRVAPQGGARLLFLFMADVKLGVGVGKGRKQAAAGDGAPRRPLAPSEKGNAAAPGGRRREAASRFKPAAPAARRFTSPSPARASAMDGAASCSRARSADRARPATTSTSPFPSQLKPSSVEAAARSATPVRHATKAHDGLSSSARSSSPSPRSESMPAPAMKIDRLVRGLPSEVSKVKVHAESASDRKRSSVRRNGIGDQCENTRPSECPATKRIVEQHRWPAMTSGRGSAGLTPASTAPSSGNASRSVSLSPWNPPAGHSPMRARPSEGTGKCLSPSNEMAKRAAIRRSRREHSDSDASSQKLEGFRSACRPSRAISVPVLRRSSSSPGKVASSASSASKACQSPSRTRPSAPFRSKCASSPAAQPGAANPVFNYIVDAPKGKNTANQVENIHKLRLLDNRYLQGRFLNAVSEATLSFRINSAEV
jgi:hypothetical protein